MFGSYISEYKEDYIGAFVCTKVWILRNNAVFESELDDYNSILLKSLDRLSK